MSNRKKKKNDTTNLNNSFALNYDDYYENVNTEREEKLSSNSSYTYINGIKRKVCEYSRTRKCSCGGYIWTIGALNICGHCQTAYIKVYSNAYEEDENNSDE